jgi:hypothetical protein
LGQFDLYENIKPKSAISILHKRKAMRICMIALLLIFNSLQLTGQEIIKSVTINYGGAANFHFNALNKYQNGIDYTDWTELEVYSKNDAGAGNPANSEWRLSVKALSPNIMGDDGTNTLPLETIELSIVISSGAGTAVSPIILTDNYQTIASGLQNNVTEISTVTISYHCGTTNSVSGEAPGFYYIDLDFLLEQIP